MSEACGPGSDGSDTSRDRRQTLDEADVGEAEDHLAGVGVPHGDDVAGHGGEPPAVGAEREAGAAHAVQLAADVARLRVEEQDSLQVRLGDGESPAVLGERHRA